jgi:hypothetical protein
VRIPPGNWFAPPGSNRSGSGSNEAAGAFDGKDRFRRFSERAGRKEYERCAGPETENAGADPPGSLGKAEDDERVRADAFHRTCRGNGDGMQAKGIRRNTGSPIGDCNTDQRATRERQAGPYGVAERSVVPAKSGNADGGKGPQLKGNDRSDNG